MSLKKDEEGLIKQDEACKVVYETAIYDDVFFESLQLGILIDACEEQIKQNHDILLAALRPADQMERLVDMLESVLGGASDIAKNLDPTMIGSIVERLGNLDDKSIIDAVVEKQELKVAEKPKKPRKLRAKKEDKDEDFQIPGQISVDELPVSE